MSHWTDWEISERELMECANATIFRDRPDLQFKFDASAPPLIDAPNPHSAPPHSDNKEKDVG